MQTKPIIRPWERASGYRLNPDPYYQSPEWKHLRHSFRQGFTKVGDFHLSNQYCIDCYIEYGKLIPGANTDHKTRRKDGGTDTGDNLQTQCDTHHARKSAKEGNELRKNGKKSHW